MPYEQQARLLFAQMDANGDGELSLHEMRAYIELKGEEPLANELFRSLPGGNDGAVSGADAAYALALCTSGTARARVDAACECAAPNPTLLRSRA